MTTPITTKQQKDIPPQPNSIGYGEDVWSYGKEWGLDQLVQEEKNDVLDPLQQIGDSIYWTQSIAPGKFYSRTRNGGQLATPALQTLQQQFEQQVIGRIRDGQAAQPRPVPMPAPEAADFHQDHKNAPGPGSHVHHSHDLNENGRGSSSDGEGSSRTCSGDSPGSSSSSCSSSSSSRDQSDEEEGEISTEEEEVGTSGRKRDGRKRPRRKRRGGKRAGRKQGESANGPGRGRRRRRHWANGLAQKEIERRRSHPAALHPDIGFNEPGQLAEGPLCKCSWAARQTGVRHGKYQGEGPVPKCDWQSSNVHGLHHYVLQVEPDPALFSRRPTQIQMDGHCYEFDGFSVFFHQPLPKSFPQLPINQWTQQYQVRFVQENAPESFTVHDLELFHTFLFDQVLELYDLKRQMNIGREELDGSCLFYHCLPRFARKLPENGKELLPMSAILAHFLSVFAPLTDSRLAGHFRSNPRTFHEFAHLQKGQICINPQKKPMAIRMDLLAAADLEEAGDNFHPMITHFGVKPSAFAYLKRPQLQEACRKHSELRRRFGKKNLALLGEEERRQLRESEASLLELKRKCKIRRDTTIRLNSRGFYCTGIWPDMVQHGLLLVLACQHVRFHCSLDELERKVLAYTFKDRALLELALIHPSFRTNYGTNPDHAKNVLNNCGIRMGGNSTATTSPAGNGNCAVSAMNNGKTPTTTKSSPFADAPKSGRRKGVKTLMQIMAMQGSKGASPHQTLVRHNERLEFLGDTVVEFLTTVHLFFLFTDLDEGGLATFRSALVQNRHLATLADRLGLHRFMVYAHGPDLCHETDLRHAMANTFEALMAALFLDAGLAECDRIFGHALFKEDPKMLAIWNSLPEHPLKRDSPFGDRHLIDAVPCLQQLTQFEQSIGIRFRHIRLLAKAFTRRNVPFNYLTLGHNQRLEFLGDTVLQLLASDYLYRHFPGHQEGHLSLLRTCLVSNRTQSVVCDDLALARYLVVPKTLLRKCPQAQLRIKDKADLVESFLGALYVDRGLRYCRHFCFVSFFPRLKHFILSQSWNDPKSQLQQCCLALRDPRARGDPDIPQYKTIGIEGPTNTRIYRVAVYFREKRLAIGCGAKMHLAQMEAAKAALAENSHLFGSANNVEMTAHQPPKWHNERRDPKADGKIENRKQRKRAPEATSSPAGGIKKPREDFFESSATSSGRNAGETTKVRKNAYSQESYWSPRVSAIQQSLQKNGWHQPITSAGRKDNIIEGEHRTEPGRFSLTLSPPPPPPKI